MSDIWTLVRDILESFCCVKDKESCKKIREGEKKREKEEGKEGRKNKEDSLSYTFK